MSNEQTLFAQLPDVGSDQRKTGLTLESELFAACTVVSEAAWHLAIARRDGDQHDINQRTIALVVSEKARNDVISRFSHTKAVAIRPKLVSTPAPIQADLPLTTKRTAALGIKVPGKRTQHVTKTGGHRTRRMLHDMYGMAEGRDYEVKRQSNRGSNVVREFIFTGDAAQAIDGRAIKGQLTRALENNLVSLVISRSKKSGVATLTLAVEWKSF